MSFETIPLCQGILHQRLASNLILAIRREHHHNVLYSHDEAGRTTVYAPHSNRLIRELGNLQSQGSGQQNNWTNSQRLLRGVYQENWCLQLCSVLRSADASLCVILHPKDWFFLCTGGGNWPIRQSVLSKPCPSHQRKAGGLWQLPIHF